MVTKGETSLAKTCPCASSTRILASDLEEGLGEERILRETCDLLGDLCGWEKGKGSTPCLLPRRMVLTIYQRDELMHRRNAGLRLVEPVIGYLAAQISLAGDRWPWRVVPSPANPLRILLQISLPFIIGSGKNIYGFCSVILARQPSAVAISAIEMLQIPSTKRLRL